MKNLHAERRKEAARQVKATALEKQQKEHQKAIQRAADEARRKMKEK